MLLQRESWTVNPHRRKHDLLEENADSLEKTTAIVIRKTKLTDTSFIVHWSGVKTGIIKTVAKGARRPKSPFAGKLDLFFEAEVEIVRSRKSDLHILKELRLTNPRSGIRKSYLRTLAASYFTALIKNCAEPETPIDSLHDLLRRGLDYLDHSRPDLKAVLHFEKSLAQELGIYERGVPAIECFRRTHHQISPIREELVASVNENTK